MELEFLQVLAQYVPLGLWTALLLWMTWLQRKKSKKVEARPKAPIKCNQEQLCNQEEILAHMHTQTEMLEACVGKIDRGIETMRSESPRGRILRLQQLSKKNE